MADENQKSSAKVPFREKRQVLFLGLMLFLFCAVAGLALGLVYENTKNLIADKKLSVQMAAFREVLPGRDDAVLEEFPVPEEFAGTLKNLFYAENYGYVMTVYGFGYKGDLIEIAVGISLEDEITGVRILSHSETPGLGSNAAKPSFLNQFTGRSALSDLVAVKDGADLDYEIDGLTGATKTTKGVVEAVNFACRYYRNFIKEVPADGELQ